MLEVLIFMFQNYVEAQYNVRHLITEELSLVQELSEAGFEHQDIMGAFDWYKDLRHLISQPHHLYLSNPPSIRVYSPAELDKIDAESLSFLNFIEQAQVIQPNERDLILDRAMALKQAITIEEIRWITMMMLWDDTRKKDYLFVEDAVFNPRGLTLQ